MLDVPAAAKLEERAAGYTQVPEAPAAAKSKERAAENSQVLDVTAAAQPEERAAEDVQVLGVPAAAKPEERAAGDVWVPEVPATEQPKKRAVAAGDGQVQKTPAAALGEEPAATTHLQPEDVADATDVADNTINVFYKEYDAETRNLESVEIVVGDDEHVQIESSNPTDFQVTAGHFEQMEKPSAAAQPLGYAAIDVEAQKTPGAAMADELAAEQTAFTNLTGTETGTRSIAELEDTGATVFVGNPAAPIKMVSSGMQNISKVGLSVGPMAEMGVEFDQFPAPPWQDHGQVFGISTGIPRMDTQGTTLNEEEEPCRLWERGGYDETTNSAEVQRIASVQDEMGRAGIAADPLKNSTSRLASTKNGAGEVLSKIGQTDIDPG